jgi:hypothetical protein
LIRNVTEYGEFFKRCVGGAEQQTAAPEPTIGHEG